MKNETARRIPRVCLLVFAVGLAICAQVAPMPLARGDACTPYHRLSNGTVEDQNTHLVWQQDPPWVPRTWDEATSYCEHLRLGDEEGWRLPTAAELQTVVDEHAYEFLGNPWIFTVDAVPLPSGPCQFWTATGKYGSTSNEIFVVDFRDGSAFPIRRADDSPFALCVRTPPAP